MHTDTLDRVFAGMNCFPTTPFDDQDRLALPVLEQHVEWQLAAEPAAVFPACGTGEHWSLTWEERVAIWEAVVQQVGTRLPVFAGWAGTTPKDLAVLSRLETLGVSGILLMPPAPWSAGPDGLRDYHLRAAAHTSLPRILYLENARGRSPAWWHDLAVEAGVRGIKDGTGDLDFVTGLLAEGWPSSRLINGTPTAEWLAPAYLALGIRGWSSAILNFAPDLARRLRAAILDRDSSYVAAVRDRVLAPLRRLRRHDPAYAVSLIKASVAHRGFAVGRTRAPLSWPEPTAMAALETLLVAADDVTNAEQLGDVVS